ncbi:phosphatidylglycerophosphatase A [Candidatus Gracilibacteria bacterium]|nr:phosphatidylglycerophosphatase A [Candidatus Gracilibacteria bacterium]MCF7819228.1 phosphatidylglycerophosphatase A [Candidatus Gracilibacteria bacterium]
MKKNTLARGFLSFGGIGFVPAIPGTVASSIALLLLVWADGLLGLDFFYRTLFLFILGALVFFPSLFATRKLQLSSNDQPWIVMDEVLGMILALAPLFFWYETDYWWFVGFGLFRFFDIVKPLGIRFLDQKNTPISVFLDDIVAGSYAGGCLLILLYVAG